MKMILINTDKHRQTSIAISFTLKTSIQDATRQDQDACVYEVGRHHDAVACIMSSCPRSKYLVVQPIIIGHSRDAIRGRIRAIHCPQHDKH